LLKGSSMSSTSERTWKSILSTKRTESRIVTFSNVETVLRRMNGMCDLLTAMS